MPNIVVCPSCGAPVRFISAQSLLAVCGYCRASLIRRDLDVEQVGTMAALLEDVTPLQLGAEGRWRGLHFAVVGRLQIRWEQGRWNEWYCVFDDGRGGWLGDAAGEYTIAFEAPVTERLPSPDSLRVGAGVTLGGVVYEVTERREAEVIAGEGELPLRVGSGWKTTTVDLRTTTAHFATLDYSDETPRLYTGEVVELKGLGLRGLRELDG